MHDQFAVIEHHPTPLGLALPAQRKPAGLLLKGVFHRAGDSPHLHIGEAVADHEPIRQGGDLFHPDQADVHGLAVITGFSGETGQGLAVAVTGPEGWGDGRRLGRRRGRFSHRRSHW